MGGGGKGRERRVWGSEATGGSYRRAWGGGEEGAVGGRYMDLNGPLSIHQDSETGNEYTLRYFFITFDKGSCYNKAKDNTVLCCTINTLQYFIRIYNE